MTHTPPLEASRNHFSAAQAAAQALRDEYDNGPSVGQGARVAAHHNAVRFGLKAAEVSALLAIAEGLEVLVADAVDGIELRQRLADRAPSTTAVRARLAEAAK